MSALYISFLVLALVVLFYYVITSYIHFVLELNSINKINKLCGRVPQYAPAPCKLTFDLLTLKVVSESRGLLLCQF